VSKYSTRITDKYSNTLWTEYSTAKQIIGHIGDGFYGSNDPISGPKVLFKTCIAMKFVDDDDELTVSKH